MRKQYIAINLRDFHRPSKKWMSGSDAKVEIMVIGAKNMENAKRTAKTGNNDAWLIASASNTNNIAYADIE